MLRQGRKQTGHNAQIGKQREQETNKDQQIKPTKNQNCTWSSNSRSNRNNGNNSDTLPRVSLSSSPNQHGGETNKQSQQELPQRCTPTNRYDGIVVVVVKFQLCPPASVCVCFVVCGCVIKFE